MSETAPETPPGVTPEPEVARTASHLTLWLEQHVTPDIADIRGKAENASTAAGKAVAASKAHAPLIADMAQLLSEVVKTTAPGDAVKVAKAEGIAVEAARIATELLAGGM